MKMYLIWFFSSIAIFSLLHSAQAQISPVDTGSTVFMGSFSLSSAGGERYEGEDGKRKTNFYLETTFGYFISRGLSLGLKIGLSSWSWWGRTSSSYDFGPQLLYFFNSSRKREKIKGSIYPFLTVSYILNGASAGSGEGILGENESTFQVGGGMNIMVSESAGLFLLAAFDLDRKYYQNMDSITGNRLGFYAGFNLFLY